MSDGRSTLWRTSLCGVVMALTVFSTGCAVDASSDGDDDTEEVQADLIVGESETPLGTGKLAEPVSLPQFPQTTLVSKSLGGKIDELVEPEPEPWHPRSQDDSGKVTVGTGSALPDDHK
jgi:hypothetical protein